jgi:nucleoside-diphosphate-sugar epimerase
MKIAIIGSSGFFGSSLYSAAQEEAGIEVYGVTRIMFNSFCKEKSSEIDVVINSSMPSKRFWAENNPELDFIETVGKTREIINAFPKAKVIQISSVSARTQLHKVYGRHKREAEKLLDLNNNAIFRLGPLYGEGIAKGVIIDLIHDEKVFLSGESKYAFTDVSWAAKKIIENIGVTGIVEFGAKGAVTIDTLRNELSSTSECEGDTDDQFFEEYFPDSPEASDVIEFAVQLKERIGM